MAGSWSVEETQALIAIWSQENIQRQLDRVHRNRDIVSSGHEVLKNSFAFFEHHIIIDNWQLLYRTLSYTFLAPAYGISAA